jgi:hypothetical protein
LFPTLDNVYDGCWLDLARGEALVVTGRLPEARYTSFVFYDRWFATPDYRRVGCLVTGQEMVVSDERTYELLRGAAGPWSAHLGRYRRFAPRHPRHPDPAAGAARATGAASRPHCR